MGGPASRKPTAELRRSGWTLSDASAIRFGRAPPSPTPVKNRATSSIFTSGAKAVAIDKAPNSRMEATSTDLRPTRSDRRPPMIAPNISPKVLMLRNKPRSPGLIEKIGPRIGAVTPGACRSNPSKMAAKAQSATATPACTGDRAAAATRT